MGISKAQVEKGLFLGRARMGKGEDPLILGADPFNCTQGLEPPVGLFPVFQAVAAKPLSSILFESQGNSRTPGVSSRSISELSIRWGTQ
jgi:hypothetical protein